MSELQRAKEDDSTIVTVKDQHKHYRYLTRKPNLPCDIVDPHLPRSFPSRVFIRVKGVLAAIENGSLPLMPLSPSATRTKGVPAAEWPQDFTFPTRHGGGVPSLLDATPPPSRSGPKAPGGGGHWRGGGVQGGAMGGGAVGSVSWGGGPGGAIWGVVGGGGGHRLPLPPLALPLG